MPGVYKLAHDELLGPRLKLSDDPVKTTLPGVKQVYRVCGMDGTFRRDVIAIENQPSFLLQEDEEWLEAGGGQLLPIVRDGKRTQYAHKTLESARYDLRQALAHLPDAYFSLERKVPVPVEKTAQLAALQQRLIDEHVCDERTYTAAVQQHNAPIAAHAR